MAQKSIAELEADIADAKKALNKATAEFGKAKKKYTRAVQALKAARWEDMC